MPLFRPTGWTWRPPALGREVVLSPYKGTLRAQRWPRKRGLPKNPRDRARLELFALVQHAVKWLSGRERNDMEAAIKTHNRANRGQKGSAAIRARDWHHQRLMGRGFAFDLPDGRTIYPPGVHRTASKLLDHLNGRPGAFISKTDGKWWSDIPTISPAVLTVEPSGSSVRFRQL